MKAKPIILDSTPRKIKDESICLFAVLVHSKKRWSFFKKVDKSVVHSVYDTESKAKYTISHILRTHPSYISERFDFEVVKLFLKTDVNLDVGAIF